MNYIMLYHITDNPSDAEKMTKRWIFHGTKTSVLQIELGDVTLKC
jgi:hypothetical protein